MLQRVTAARERDVLPLRKSLQVHACKLTSIPRNFVCIQCFPDIWSPLPHAETPSAFLSEWGIPCFQSTL